MSSQHTLRTGVFCAITTALFASCALAATDDFDMLKYVDPLIGTANGGSFLIYRIVCSRNKSDNVPRPRVCRCDAAIWYVHPQNIVSPFTRLIISGMAKAVADTSGENQAGFAYDTKVVTGFSHMHDSGTGGVGKPESVQFHVCPCLLTCPFSPHQWVIFRFSRNQVVPATTSANANGSSQTERWPGRGILLRLTLVISVFH